MQDITSDASKAAFAITSELNDQIKAAASADEGTAVVIEFADEAAVETAQAEKEQEIIADAAAENDGSTGDATEGSGDSTDDGTTDDSVADDSEETEEESGETASEEEAGDTGGGGAAPAPHQRRTRLLRLLQCYISKPEWILWDRYDIRLKLVLRGCKNQRHIGLNSSA